VCTNFLMKYELLKKIDQNDLAICQSNLKCTSLHVQTLVRDKQSKTDGQEENNMSPSEGADINISRF